MRKTRKKIYLITALAALAALFGTGYGVNKANSEKVLAAEQKNEVVEMRVIGTTDLHGQLNSTDYEMNVDYNNGGLARVFDLIQKTKKELPEENTITVDAGDTLFDYTTEYIYSEYQNEIQPIYKAMALVGYDAITLGNHDFDYGYDYILKQLNETGLRDITVVSNVWDSKTGEHPFLENMMLTRNMVTKSGKQVEINIGIMGMTIPNLSGKTHSYAGILKSEDTVISAKQQAQKLKEMGADIIICVAHTGIGPVEPALNFKNVAYALTKIEEIDVVVCGHEHNLFPTSDMTSPYYNLPQVDRKTYLINGKNVIMAGDRGRAIGVVDLTLEIREDYIKIADRKSELRMVTGENTTENKVIASQYGELEDELLKYSTDIIGELDEGTIIQNYYGLLGDNIAIQLFNNSKISYALNYINTNAKEYKDYPIVAASTYDSFGEGSIDDFVTISGKFTEADLAQLQQYNNYLYLYTITGKQLREWLEWSASAYENIYFKSNWSNKTMSELMKETGLKSLIREDWINDWSNFFIFDGIEYVINPGVEPRYDFSGNQINTTNRIKSMTYNGKEITDDMEFIIATNKITKPVGANSGVEKQVVYKSFNRSQSVLADYLKQMSISGSLIPQVDHNWKVDFPISDYKFITKIPYYGHDLFQETPWYEEYLKEENGYRYYIASYPKVNSDTSGPTIIVAPSVTHPTASPYDIAVYAMDASEIKRLRYIQGDFDVNYTGWSTAREITNHTFKVYDNTTFTVYAEDIHGNKTVQKIVINNFRDDMLARPTVEKYTNRKANIKGTAEPGATIVFEAYTGTYKTTVGRDGKYSYPLPSQPSGTMVSIYVVDEEKNIESERITVPVHRTGPNKPSINSIFNISPYISGNTNDSDATVIAIIEDTVYVSDQGGKELYEANLDIYDPTLKIIETEFEVNSLGYYILKLPPQVGGTKVTVYNLDHVSRSSRATTATVEEVAPNAPQVYEISNIEKALSGYVPSNTKTIYTVTLKIGDKSYTTKTDKEGKFTFNFTDQLQAGQILTVTASDNLRGNRSSYPTEVLVKDIESYINQNSTALTINKITVNSFLISGNSMDSGTVYIALVNSEKESFENELYLVEADEFGRYRYSLEQGLEEGTKIYTMVRFTDGKILMANKTEVLPGLPKKPELLQEVTNADKQVSIVTNKNCEVTLIIGDKTYATSEFIYNEETNQYIYTLEIDRAVSGTPITISATNVTGASDIFTSQVVKAAPDQPKVDAVKTGDQKITGKVEVLDEETKIFAKIGKKTYEGTVNKKGKFEIEVPKQKKGKAIKVWGTNLAGRGPLIKITVE